MSEETDEKIKIIQRTVVHKGVDKFGKPKIDRDETLQLQSDKIKSLMLEARIDEWDWIEVVREASDVAILDTFSDRLDQLKGEKK